ncbi:ATP-binding cassette domain-containing protein [Corynebacterium sp.]|uniref:ATP-binding cassette domain-containing protein n=1 Tax=Corynebacterium sp. TaxID=1720 RepID=UPI003B3B0725
MTPPTTASLPDPLVEVRGLDRTFGTRRVLRGVTFDLRRTGIVGLVGRNGVGKTTLMGILAGQLRRSGGEATVAGEDPFDNAAAMDHVCFTGVDVVYPPQWQVNTVLSVAAARYPRWDTDLADDLAGRFGVARFGRVSSLSTGQRSLVSIIVGLASRAPLTLLDEPYSGLDVQNRRLFYEVLAEAQENDPRCIVLSTHQLADAGRIVDRLLILGAGGYLTHDIDGADLGDRVVRLTGSTERMSTVLDDLRASPDVRVTGMRDIAGSMSVDVDLQGSRLSALAMPSGVTVERLGTEDTVIALTGGPES